MLRAYSHDPDMYTDWLDSPEAPASVAPESTTAADVSRVRFGQFLRRPSLADFLRGMVHANLSLDNALRADGLLDQVDTLAQGESVEGWQ